MKKVKEGQSTKPHSLHCSPSPPTPPSHQTSYSSSGVNFCGGSTREKIMLCLAQQELRFPGRY